MTQRDQAMGLRPRIVPVLLLKQDGLYKGVRFSNYTYVGDPMNAVRIFNEKNVDELFLFDIAATQEKRLPRVDFLQRVADECYMPFGVGGGVRSVEDFRKLLQAGAEKVAVNTAAVVRPALIREAADTFGSQSVTVCVDVRRNWRGRYAVYTHSGRKKTRLDPVSWAQEAETLGAGEILINVIDRDGTGDGYDVALVQRVAATVQVPVIACGGAGRLEHFAEVLTSGGAAAAAAGSFFVFHGKHRTVLLHYPDEMDRMKAWTA